MISMSLSQAADALDGRLIGPDLYFSGVSKDSRTLQPGELFFALHGPNFDGHDKCAEAIAAGASAVVVEHTIAGLPSQILVAATRTGLGRLASSWRHRFPVPVLAVTGSAGKTTVKEMLGHVMAELGPALITQGNLNNDIGVPLTLFRLDGGHRCAVVEMGANHRGDIEKLTSIARPVVGVITLCAPAHLEGFGSIENVARAKGEIVSSLPDDGVAVINNEDKFAPLWRDMAGRRKIVTFGEGGDVRASNITSDRRCTRFTLSCDLGAIDIELAYRGRHNISNALAAAAAALAADVSLDSIATGLAKARPIAGRLMPRLGVHGMHLLDDSYNANPASVAAAIEVLREEPGSRWLVFGDMGELGSDTKTWHENVGRFAAEAGIDRLFTIGELARHAQSHFGGEGIHYTKQAELVDALSNESQRTEAPVTVLIKGSRSMQLDRVVDALCSAESAPC